MSSSLPPSGGPGGFSPRLGGLSTSAPYNPGAYYLVAFFGGILALVYVAFANLSRISKVRGVETKTWAVIAGACIAGAVFLAVSPASWWDPTRNVRLGLRAVALIASAALYMLHRGPAFGARARFEEYTSMWKAIGPIIGAAIAQGILSVLVGSLRGVT